MGRPGTFKPGQSGNPSGRPKQAPEVADALVRLRALAPRAIERIAELLESTDDKVVAAMAREVLDRTYGKPVQPTDNVHSTPDGSAPGLVVTFVGPGEK